MIKTVFFDIGSVIFNEDVLRFKLFEILWHYLRKTNPEWTFERIIEVREYLITEFDDPSPHLTIARKHLSEREYKQFQSQINYFSGHYYYRYIYLIPGILYVIRSLFHYYHLGIIANQPREVRRLLKRYNLNLYFKTVTISKEINLSKPDPKIFVWALEDCKTAPEQAVMIGDRLDHDIAPAKSLGMYTILAKFSNKVKGILPQEQRERSYFTSLENVPNWPQLPRKKSEVPHATAHRVEDILKITEGLEFPSSPKAGEGPEEPVELSLWQILKEITEGGIEPP